MPCLLIKKAQSSATHSDRYTCACSVSSAYGAPQYVAAVQGVATPSAPDSNLLKICDYSMSA